MKQILKFVVGLAIVAAVFRFAVDRVVKQALANAEEGIPISEIEWKSVELPAFDSQYEWKSGWESDQGANEDWGKDQ